MTDIISINVTSLKVIRGELNVTLEHAARHFESFVTDRNNLEPLKETLSSLVDLIGIFKLLALPGTEEFVSNMHELTEKLVNGDLKQNNFNLSALSHAYVGLPCYIEYLVDREQAIPALILPFVNELRAALRSPLILESEQAQFSLSTPADLTDSSASVSDELASLAVRQRQLFQMGLIGLIREENTQLKLQLMHRAMQRLAQASGNLAVRTQWRIAEAAFEGFLNDDLQLNFTRKRVFSQIDAAMRHFIQEGCSGDATAAPELITELIYLNYISDGAHKASQEVKLHCQLPAVEFTDKTLSRERDIMQGPNAETIVTMVAALRDELAQTKEILEIAAQDESGATDLSPLLSLFQRSGDILSVVGLTSASNMLADMTAKIQAWVDAGNYDKDHLQGIADGLLYVESTLSSLSRLDLDFTNKNESDESKMALMAKTQLQEAEAIVLTEAQVGIVHAKKDISSFVESNFDMQHIASIAETLTSVRGGVSILKLDRATAVINSCIAFIQGIQEKGIEENKAGDILETMADGLISLEYYLSEVELHGVAPPNVLEVAEQSLASLGYPVEK